MVPVRRIPAHIPQPWYGLQKGALEFREKGEPFYDAILASIHLRYRLLPYIYSLAGQVWREDGTMMRLLAFDFPQDERALDIADEYMFGPSLLVCPVTQPMYYEAGGAVLDKTEKAGKYTCPQVPPGMIFATGKIRRRTDDNGSR